MKRSGYIAGDKLAHFRTQHPALEATTYRRRIPGSTSKKHKLTKDIRWPDRWKQRQDLLEAFGVAKDATFCATTASRLLEEVKRQMSILEERRLFCVDAEHSWPKEDSGQYLGTKRWDCRMVEEMNTVEDLLERLGAVMETCEGIVCACQRVVRTAEDKIRRAKSDANIRD